MTLNKIVKYQKAVIKDERAGQKLQTKDCGNRDRTGTF
jgi:hypothetical protein